MQKQSFASTFFSLLEHQRQLRERPSFDEYIGRYSGEKGKRSIREVFEGHSGVRMALKPLFISIFSSISFNGNNESNVQRIYMEILLGSLSQHEGKILHDYYSEVRDSGRPIYSIDYEFERKALELMNEHRWFSE